MKKRSASRQQLSVFMLAMMNVAIIMNLRGLPMMAKEGLAMVFFLLFASIIFLLPLLIFAENWHRKKKLLCTRSDLDLLL